MEGGANLTNLKLTADIEVPGAKGSGTSVSQIRDYLLNNRNHCRDSFYLLKTVKRDFFIKRRFHLLKFSA